MPALTQAVLGVIEPGAVAACCATRTGRIAVIATESTVHVPVFAPLMAPMLAAGVAIVDSAATTADALRRALDAAELTRAAPDTGTVRLPATDGAV